MAFSLKFISSRSHSVCRVSGKRADLVLHDSKPKGWEKIGNIHLESCNRTLEETRPYDPVHFIGENKHSKTNRTRSNIHKSVTEA